VADTERILVGQRVLGIVRVTDVPASGRGRRFLVKRELCRKDELDALVADYVAEAAALGECPMRAFASGWPWRCRDERSEPARRTLIVRSGRRPPRGSGRRGFGG
jgi:hypothetical protein